MALNKIRLGDYIEKSTQNNSNLQYGTELIAGVNNEGVFTTPKGDTSDVNLKPYKIVNNGAFVYNPTRFDLGSIAYRTEGMCIVSHLYMIFYLNDEGKKIIDPMYLYIYLRRKEFQREVTFRNFGSQRPEFNYNDISDIIMPLPDIETQRRYAEIHNSMVENQRNYERGLEDLKIVCNAYIERLRRKERLYRIGDYIALYNEKNVDGAITLEQGINIDKQFITPQRSNSNLTGRKIVRHGMFAYCTQLNNENVAIAYRDGEDCVVSSVYDVFEISKPQELLPEYLMLWLIRPEFGRFVYWASVGSAYEFLNYENLAGYMIPVPDIEIQKAIGDIYLSYVKRKSINERLKENIKNLGSILIKGSIEAAS